MGVAQGLQSARREEDLTMTGDRLEPDGITLVTIETWIAAGWIRPAAVDDAPLDEIDRARARLIRDLKQGLGVNDEAIPIILDLLDQVHGLRRALREVLVQRSRPPAD